MEVATPPVVAGRAPEVWDTGGGGDSTSSDTADDSDENSHDSHDDTSSGNGEGRPGSIYVGLPPEENDVDADAEQSPEAGDDDDDDDGADHNHDTDTDSPARGGYGKLPAPQAHPLSRRRSSTAPSTLMSEVLKMRALARPLRCLLPLRQMKRGEEMRFRETPQVSKPVTATECQWPGPRFIADTAATPRCPHYDVAANPKKRDAHRQHYLRVGATTTTASTVSTGSAGRPWSPAVPAASVVSGGTGTGTGAGTDPQPPPERHVALAKQAVTVYVRDPNDTRLYNLLNGGEKRWARPSSEEDLQAAPEPNAQPQPQPNTARRPTPPDAEKEASPSSPVNAAPTPPTTTTCETLVFDSKFESGNLSRVMQCGRYSYELLVDYDLGTKSHAQWYYFSIANVQPHRPYTFHIMNFLKSKSLYNDGMKVLYHVPGKGWTRGGTDIRYYPNQLHASQHSFDRVHYTLSFTLTFTEAEAADPNEPIHIAHCQPYSYSELREYLVSLEKNSATRQFCRRKEMWRTLAGNAVDVLTITGYAPTPEHLEQRPGVFISARVHPGESNSSYVVKGLIDYLTSSHPRATELRNRVVFKIVPMLNPDGVINGNYRCSLSGVDLNRKWGKPCEKAHPEIYNVKKILTEFANERDVALFVDIHGHSRKPGAFMYGCGGIAERAFPKIFSTLCPHFIYDSCSFVMAWGKRNTARVVGFRELGISNSYTLEISFGGSSSEHFTTSDLEGTGKALCESVAAYLDDATRAQVLHSLLHTRDTTEKDEIGSDDSDSDTETVRPASSGVSAKPGSGGGGAPRRASFALGPTGSPEEVLAPGAQKPRPPKKQPSGRNFRGKRHRGRKVGS